MRIPNADASCTLARACKDIFAQGTPQKVSEVLKGQDTPPVQVDISEEGWKAYKEKFQQNPQMQEFKGLNIRLLPGEMECLNEGWPDIEEFLNCGTNEKMMRGKIPQAYHDPFVSVIDKMSMLLKTYAEAYDGIVKEYQNGTREKYIIDMEAEGLYRKATMEEDLEYLRKELESRAGGLEKYDHKYDCLIRELMAGSAMKGFLAGTSLRDVLKSSIYYESMKDEENIVNIKQSIMKAASDFVNQYNGSGSIELNVQVF